MSEHPAEQLSAYADGELGGEAARQVETHLERCTECARELALIRTLGNAMRDVPAAESRRSAWDGVHRRITRPTGWVLLVVGTLLWLALGVRSWLREELTLEWVATTAVGVGLVMLGIGIAYEQYREWRGSPYKELER